MTEWLRRAGRGRLPGDDGLVIWSVAEGNRGRRWRWLIQRSRGVLFVAGLLELAPDGRFGRLEYAAFGGLLTFHPDSDQQAAHGNAVTGEQVDHIATRWHPDWRVGIVGDPFGTAASEWAGVGLVVRPGGDGLAWTEPGLHPDVPGLAHDGRGVPQLDDAREWPLEVDA